MSSRGSSIREEMQWRTILANSQLRLEEKRKLKSAAYYIRKKAAARVLGEAKASTKTAADEQLASFGY